MKILITGANGMVARAAAAHCRAAGDEVTALTRRELNIGNREDVMDAIRNTGPDKVLNCAAYTDVDGAETSIDASYAANSTGVENLAEACRDQNAVFVTISTDYVFRGDKDGFYTENDQPDPQSVYAKSKLDGERRAAAANPKSIIVRSGWIYGRGGTNFLSIMHGLFADGKSITAIGDSFGTPTFAGDLARRIRELAVVGRPGLYHAANSGPGTSYYEFARRVAALGGFDLGLVKKVAFEELNRPAARPVNSRLACLVSEKIGLAPMPDWEVALKAFVEREKGIRKQN